MKCKGEGRFMWERVFRSLCVDSREMESREKVVWFLLVKCESKRGRGGQEERLRKS